MNISLHWHIVFIYLMNALGAFVRPKGITSHSYNPYLVLKVIFHSSPSFIPLFKSIFVKIHDPCNSSNLSSSLGMGCLYFTVMLLIALQSTHFLQVPSFLGTSSTGTAHRLMLSLMCPLTINSSTCL
jgi:hypothetical protein